MNRTTRRGLLAGGIVLAAGAVGAIEARGRVHPHQLWLEWSGACGDDPPRPADSGASIVEGSFASDAARADVPYTLALPAGATEGAPMAVCVCLPGRGNSSRAFVDQLWLPDWVAAADVAPFALASIRGGASYWHRRSDGSDMMAALRDEFVPLLAARHGLGADGTRRAIYGWSMGGYGALLALVEAPGVFHVAVAQSPALWPSQAAQAGSVPDAFDGPADYTTHDVSTHLPALEAVPLRIDVGRDDPFEASVSTLRNALTPAPAGGVAPGCHDNSFWRRTAHASMAFVGGRLAAP